MSFLALEVHENIQDFQHSVGGQIPGARQIGGSIHAIPRLEVTLTCQQRYRKIQVRLQRPHGLLSDSFQLPFLLQPNILVIAALNAHFAKRKQQQKGEEGNEGSLYKLDAEINS